jgi:hypothetical protein
MPDMPKVEVLAALIVFRLLYLLIPLALSCIVVVVAEWRSFGEAVGAIGAGVTRDKPSLPPGRADIEP